MEEGIAAGLKPWEIYRFTLYELNVWVEKCNQQKIDEQEGRNRQAYSTAALSLMREDFPKYEEAFEPIDEEFEPMTDEQLQKECAAKGLRMPDIPD